MRIEQRHADAGVFAEFEVVQAANQSAFCDDLSLFPKSLLLFCALVSELARATLKDSGIFPSNKALWEQEAA
jgi:hypothetical protein